MEKTVFHNQVSDRTIKVDVFRSLQIHNSLLCTIIFNAAHTKKKTNEKNTPNKTCMSMVKLQRTRFSWIFVSFMLKKHQVKN